MVVFIICIVLIFIVIIAIASIFSAIKVKLIDFTIKDFDDLKTILSLIKNKEYVKIFDYIDFILKLEICVLNKIPIFNFKISDDGIEKFLRKQIRKNKLKKEEREAEKFIKEDKTEIEDDIPNINLEKLNLLMNLGTDNASLTALSTTALTILISIALPFLTDRIIPENYNYEINAIYIDKPIFNINASLVLSMPTIDAIKLIR